MLMAKSGRFVIMEGFPDDVVVFHVEGAISYNDYVKTLIPLIRNKVSLSDKIKLLCSIGEDFDGFTLGAMWADTRFGLRYFRKISKLALVSDITWVRGIAKIVSFLLPHPVRIFNDADISGAKSWIVSRVNKKYKK